MSPVATLEIEKPAEEVVREIQSRRDVPWQGIAPVSLNHFGTGLSLDKALEHCGLNFHVEKRKSFFDGGNGKHIIVPHEFAVVRTDTNVKLGNCTKKYQIVQQKTLAEFGEYCTQDTDLVVETAGVLSGGRRVWILLRVQQDLYVAGDNIAPYLLLTNSHDGSSGLIALLTHIRVVCQNTLMMAIRGAKYKISLRHVGNMVEAFREKVKVLNLKKTGNETFLEMAEKLVAIKVAESQIKTLVNEVLLPEPKGKDLSKKGETMLNEARKIVLGCMDVTDLQNVKGTGWGVFNGVADAADHARGFRVSKNDEDGRLAQERGFTRTFEDLGWKTKTLNFLLSLPQ